MLAVNSHGPAMILDMKFRQVREGAERLTYARAELVGGSLMKSWA